MELFQFCGQKVLEFLICGFLYEKCFVLILLENIFTCNMSLIFWESSETCLYHDTFIILNRKVTILKNPCSLALKFILFQVLSLHYLDNTDGNI